MVTRADKGATAPADTIDRWRRALPRARTMDEVASDYLSSMPLSRSHLAPPTSRASAMPDSLDEGRLREFWNKRYSDFTLSESGWLGAGEHLNERIYACKRQALRRAIASLGLARSASWSVLDAGCGQGHFARFYRREYPRPPMSASTSPSAPSRTSGNHRGRRVPRRRSVQWDDPAERTFDIVQSFEVLI
jgi:hypothetical protein